MTPERALASIGSLVDGAGVIRRFVGGPVSRSYLVERGTDRWVLRIDTPAAAELGLDRGAEAVALAHAHAAAVGPRLAHVDVENGIQLTHYVHGRAWTAEDLSDTENLGRLGQLLRRVHAIEGSGQPFAIDAKAARYADSLGSAEARVLADKICTSYRRIARPAAEWRLCHNDPISANIVDAGEALCLIDWEYAAVGDPFFDLAVVVQHHGLTADQGRSLLCAYRGEVHDAEMRRMEEWCVLYEQLRALWQLAVDDSDWH
jgi:thiamine kinase